MLPLVEDAVWYGQYNAILIIALVGGAIAAFVLQRWEIAVFTTIIVIAIRLLASVLNTLSKAVRGSPLIYSQKIEQKKDGGAIT